MNIRAIDRAPPLDPTTPRGRFEEAYAKITHIGADPLPTVIADRVELFPVDRTLIGVSTDPDEWTRLRDGDADALAAIYHRHVDAVYGFAFRRTASWSAAEEVVQATFTSLWRQARKHRLPPLSLETARPLLVRMAANECRNVDRSSRRRRALYRRLQLREAPSDLAGTVSERVDDERRMSDIRRALRRLPRSQQEAIELVIWADLSIAEAAHALGVAEGTVKSRLSRGKKRLAGLLEPRLEAFL